MPTKCLSPESESARSVVVCVISPIPVLLLTNGMAPKCQIRTLVSATVLITFPVGYVPPLHGSGFPYTPPSTPKPG
ncbi:hypothetical protein H4582DRAFT_1998380, partial [Lactarius indigo]